jgi:hypothetical protein
VIRCRSNGCTGSCDQGRRDCDCGLGLPSLDTYVVDRAYQNEPFPRVAQWVDEHSVLAAVLMVVAVFALFVLGAWLDGAPA